MRPRASTIVWGGIIMLAGLLVLSINLGGLLRLPDVDPVAVVVGLIGGLGALLVIGAIVGSIISSTRERRSEQTGATASAGAPSAESESPEAVASSQAVDDSDAAERDGSGETADTLKLG